jgi:hypothetical protein
MLSRPIQSPCGHVIGRKGAVSLSKADLCPAGKMCGYGVAADTEPPLCLEINAVTDKEAKKICQEEFNQMIISPIRTGPSTGRVNKLVRQCCWTKTQVLFLADRIVNIFKSAQYSNQLLVRDALSFRETLNAISETTLNGMYLLDEISGESALMTTYKVRTKKVRQRILYEIERHYTFSRPVPCASGNFCSAGTCQYLPSVDTAAT